MIVDCRGQRCPLPVIALAREMATVAIGAVVKVVADDPAAAVDIPAWCRMRAQEYLGAEPYESATAYSVVRRS